MASKKSSRTLKAQPKVEDTHILELTEYADTHDVKAKWVVADGDGWATYTRTYTLADDADLRTLYGEAVADFPGEPKAFDLEYRDNAGNRKAGRVGQVWGSRVKFSRNYAS